MAEEGELWNSERSHLPQSGKIGLVVNLVVGLLFSLWMLMWEDFRELSLQSMMMSPLLKGFGVHEEDILAGVASQLSSRDVAKTVVGKILEPQ